MAYTRCVSALLHLTLFILLAGTPILAQTVPVERLIVAAPKPYDTLIANIERVGGTVNHQYKYIDALAVEIPTTSLLELKSIVGPEGISKDAIILSPAPSTRGRSFPGDVGEPAVAQVNNATKIFPSNIPPAGSYRLNHQDVNLHEMHRRGNTGEDVVVAVIDSGLRPGFDALYLDGSDIGGENMVPDGGMYRDVRNDPHGTFVATLISGNARFDLPGNSDLKASLNANMDRVVRDGNQLYLFGTAPNASIYSIRVFSPLEFGAPKSRLLAAMERVIELREKWDSGDRREGVNIQVANMSLGTSTIYAGRTEIEELGEEMLRKGIVPVVSVGNAGPSALTVGNPGSSFGALTVAGASYAANERVFRDLTEGVGFGVFFRPSPGTQTAWFGGRGPNADGHSDPDVAANAFGTFSQGYSNPNTVSIANGTSFSTPIVAGLAAILRQAFPSATATEIRNAIVQTADASMFADGSGTLDRGRGVINAEAAFNLLSNGCNCETLPTPPRPDRDIEQNIEGNTSLVVSHDPVPTQTFTNLKPGQISEILYEVRERTSQVVIDITDLDPTLPPDQQNQIYGDDVFVNIHSAKTSLHGPEGHYLGSAFVPEGCAECGHFVISDPEPGIMRITVMGDYSNAGTISGKVTITSTRDPRTDVTDRNTIRNERIVAIPVAIPTGVQTAEFDLRWRYDWGRYPTNDIDMAFGDPDGACALPPKKRPPFCSAGATLNSPEVVTVSNPTPGQWLVYVVGFAVPTRTDEYELRVILDGQIVPGS